MFKSFSCNRGHRWQVDVGAGLTVAVDGIVCPQCGSAAQTIVAEGADVQASVHADSMARQMDPTVAVTSDYSPDRLAGTKSNSKSDRTASQPRTIGRFEILAKLGEGGFGTVYRGRDPQLDRDVAIKLPRSDVVLSPDDRQRFLREARAAATLNHSHICPVYEAGESDGQLYLVMAYVSGRTLAVYLARGKPITEGQAATLVRKLAMALDEAHRKGIVHRDLKPSNIMINQRGEPVIMDFGLAQRNQPGDVPLTMTGMLMGTPAYMSPEQARGNSKTVGPTTDIYSLGVILYEILAGRRPFEGSFAEIFGQLLHVPAEAPSHYRPGIDVKLEQICLKATEKDASLRYQSMREFADALTEFLLARNIVSPPTATTPSQNELPLPTLDLSSTTKVAPHYHPTQGSANPIKIWIGVNAVGLVLLLIIAVAIYFRVQPSAVVVSDNPQSSGKEVEKKSASDAPDALPKSNESPPVISNPSAAATANESFSSGAEESPAIPSSTTSSLAPLSGNPVSASRDFSSFTPLFSGRDLDQWTTLDGTSIRWKIRDGYVEVLPGSGSLRTRQEFGPDFELHAEFWLPSLPGRQGQARANSGIFMLGRYEIQIVDFASSDNKDFKKLTGALYDLVPVQRSIFRPAETWQTFDISWHSPRWKNNGTIDTPGTLTVMHNDAAIIDGASFVSAETAGAPFHGPSRAGPIVLQDHGTAVRFRNVGIRSLANLPPVDAKTFEAHSYKFYDEVLTWKGAKARCETLGGHLVVIESAKENEFIARLIDQSKQVESWIGITDESEEGIWRTIHGKSITFAKWLPGQPNNKKNEEHFAIISNRKLNKDSSPLGWNWSDQPNRSIEHQPGFICEWDLVP